MYYARAIDITMATPLSKLSIGQERPTTRTLDAVMYFLQYAATYPDATLTYYPSDMALSFTLTPPTSPSNITLLSTKPFTLYCS